MPPPCTFNRVTMQFTVTTQGRQFDRLGLMYLGDTEVFRTSSSEPTPNGIVWTYIKEMEQFNALWKTEQKIIFDLPNVVNEKYTGPLSTVLTATFFTVPDSPATADQIIPISASRSGNGAGSAFTVPGDLASVSLTLPQNIERAVVSLSACGQQAEEFWYSNVFSDDVNVFEDTAGTLYGYGPFREVQLLIDGQLAGVSWPFPIIFTGGLVPGFWRPIAGIDAYDLRQHEIDISPFLPLLCDGAAHKFEIRVVGVDDKSNSLSETVNGYWIVTGTIFLFQSEPGSKTAGTTPKVVAPSPYIRTSSSVVKNAEGENQNLTYTTHVTRSLTITSDVETSSGRHPLSWTQQLSYDNYNQLTAQGLTQYTSQNTTGVDHAVLSTSTTGYTNTYRYPLTSNNSFYVASDNSVYINGTLARGLDYNVFGPSVFPSGVQSFTGSKSKPPLPDGANFNVPGRPAGQTTNISADTLAPQVSAYTGASLSTTQTGSAAYYSAVAASGNFAPGSYSFGSTTQDFEFQGINIDAATAAAAAVKGQSLMSGSGVGVGGGGGGGGGGSTELYRRHVVAVNSTVVEDEEVLVGKPLAIPAVAANTVASNDNANQIPFGVSIRALLGRGPGDGNDNGLPGQQQHQQQQQPNPLLSSRPDQTS